MASAIALVFPSELEGLPLTILEASAMGIPVLAQPKSSMPEAIIKDLTGWLLPIDRTSLWVEKLKEIAHWSEMEKSCFSEHARNFIKEHYSWDLVARQYAELYHKLVN